MSLVSLESKRIQFLFTFNMACFFRCYGYKQTFRQVITEATTTAVICYEYNFNRSDAVEMMSRKRGPPYNRSQSLA